MVELTSPMLLLDWEFCLAQIILWLPFCSIHSRVWALLWYVAMRRWWCGSDKNWGKNHGLPRKTVNESTGLSMSFTLPGKAVAQHKLEVVEISMKLLFFSCSALPLLWLIIDTMILSKCCLFQAIPQLIFCKHWIEPTTLSSTNCFIVRLKSSGWTHQLHVPFALK